MIASIAKKKKKKKENHHNSRTSYAILNQIWVNVRSGAGERICPHDSAFWCMSSSCRCDGFFLPDDTSQKNRWTDTGWDQVLNPLHTHIQAHTHIEPTLVWRSVHFVPFRWLSHSTHTHTHSLTMQKPEVMLLTDVAPLCGPGLPARLFFEMDGVLMSSRFFLNIFRVPFPSIPTSLSLTHRPPTHPPTRHLFRLPLAFSGNSVPSGPALSHDNCLCVFLLLLLVSLIEPRRLTDAQRRTAGLTAKTVRSWHPLSAHAWLWGHRGKLHLLHKV